MQEHVAVLVTLPIRPLGEPGERLRTPCLVLLPTASRFIFRRSDRVSPRFLLHTLISTFLLTPYRK